MLILGSINFYFKYIKIKIVNRFLCTLFSMISHPKHVFYVYGM